MTVIIDEKELAKKIRAKLKIECEGIKKKNINSKLAVIMVGGDPASKVYVRNKSKACEDVGIEYEEYLLDVNTTQKELIELIEKLKGLVSEYEAKSMRVNKALTEKIKSDNEMVLIAIDKIMEAIENNKQISFRYYSWTPDKEKKYSNEGKQRVVNPWDLCWDNTAYYCMTSTPENPTEARIFRVDKMDKVSVTNKDRTPEGVERFRDFNSLEFSEKHFSMFNGEMKKVTLCCDNNMANVIIDRFGTDVSMRRLDDDHFVVHIMVAVSKQFFGWLFGLGSGVKIVEPAEVVQQYKDMAKEILEQ